MLTEKQLKLIEKVVEGNSTIKECYESVQVPKTTYYYWMNHNKEFQKAMDQALEDKVKESKHNIRKNVNTYIDALTDIVRSGKNENAKVNAVSKILNYAELDPQFKQELTIKNNDEDKNTLLKKWKEKQQENKEEE
ncbi:phBC6A51 family helix-turn-helix protein [Gracilibacillus saliphilus]|uniref:phBC6A51 family helix-turn-helix protein n=1 Tax=Gracilibacillus saliphilus TaxID=543890 RepID=UPI0013D249D6|nr:phBC6A51 family helix-turn-helix protein [Gracilibacillus saliphilus]